MIGVWEGLNAKIYNWTDGKITLWGGSHALTFKVSYGDLFSSRTLMSALLLIISKTLDELMLYGY